MTPCEKLGYKVGDRFEVIGHHSFKKGDVVTLREDDGSECPAFTGENGSMVTDGVTWSFARLSDLNPVKSSKLTKSKQALADAIHASGKGWPDGANWAAQDKNGTIGIGFYRGKDKPRCRREKGVWWCGSSESHFLGRERSITGAKLLPNWHQTVLSRDEYFSAHPAAKSTAVGDNETNLAAKEELELLERGESPEQRAKLAEIYKPSIEQLAADYRNAKDYADRKQQEADAAKADADAKLAELVAAGKAIGLVLSVAAPEPELVITESGDLLEGDVIELTAGERYFKTECTMVHIPSVGLRAKSADDTENQWWDLDGYQESKWSFIRRP